MKIYKITEASEYLGVSINTLKTLANNGKIKSFKTTGEHRRFRQDDLDAYMGFVFTTSFPCIRNNGQLPKPHTFKIDKVSMIRLVWFVHISNPIRLRCCILSPIQIECNQKYKPRVAELNRKLFALVSGWIKPEFKRLESGNHAEYDKEHLLTLQGLSDEKHGENRMNKEKGVEL